MEGGRDGKQKGIRRNGWKEGVGVDGKEERKSFFMASPPSRLAPVSRRRT